MRDVAPQFSINIRLFRLIESLLLGGFVFGTLPTTTKAEVLARYVIANEDGSSDLDPSFVRPGLSAGPITRAGGLMPNTDLADAAATLGLPNFGFVSVEWPQDAFGDERMEITITPGPGLAIDFTSMSYAFGGFPRMTYRVATSLDNFAASVFGPFTSPSAGFVRESQDSLAALPLITSAITFRWYAYSDSGTPPESDLPHAGFFDGDDPFSIVFDGVVSTIAPPIVWDGGGTNNAWSTANNWSNDTAPLNDGTANVAFGGNIRLTPSVDTTRNVTSITFNNTAGAFVIGGPRSLTIGAGGITNNDTDPQTITANVTLSASQSFLAAAGDLVLNTVNIGSNALNIGGANDVKLGDVIGTGMITKTGAGILELAGSVGDGDIALSADGGTTVFSESQTLSVLSIGAGATVRLDAPASSLLPVPEPAAVGLLFSGALMFCGKRRRQWKR
jgi:hypothetical protein